MAASKNVGLRTAWPGDVFWADSELMVNSEGAWLGDKPQLFTEQAAADLIEHAQKHDVVLMTTDAPASPSPAVKE
jgi:hypothetical protein